MYIIVCLLRSFIIFEIVQKHMFFSFLRLFLKNTFVNFLKILSLIKIVYRHYVLVNHLDMINSDNNVQ